MKKRILSCLAALACLTALLAVSASAEGSETSQLFVTVDGTVDAVPVVDENGNLLSDGVEDNDPTLYEHPSFTYDSATGILTMVNDCWVNDEIQGIANARIRWTRTEEATNSYSLLAGTASTSTDYAVTVMMGETPDVVVTTEKYTFAELVYLDNEASVNLSGAATIEVKKGEAVTISCNDTETGTVTATGNTETSTLQVSGGGVIRASSGSFALTTSGPEPALIAMEANNVEGAEGVGYVEYGVLGTGISLSAEDTPKVVLAGENNTATINGIIYTNNHTGSTAESGAITLTLTGQDADSGYGDANQITSPVEVSGVPVASTLTVEAAGNSGMFALDGLYFYMYDGQNVTLANDETGVTFVSGEARVMAYSEDPSSIPPLHVNGFEIRAEDWEAWFTVSKRTETADAVCEGRMYIIPTETSTGTGWLKSEGTPYSVKLSEGGIPELLSGGVYAGAEESVDLRVSGDTVTLTGMSGSTDEGGVYLDYDSENNKLGFQGCGSVSGVTGELESFNCVFTGSGGASYTVWSNDYVAAYLTLDTNGAVRVDIPAYTSFFYYDGDVDLTSVDFTAGTVSGQTQFKAAVPDAAMTFTRTDSGVAFRTELSGSTYDADSAEGPLVTVGSTSELTLHPGEKASTTMTMPTGIDYENSGTAGDITLNIAADGTAIVNSEASTATLSVTGSPKVAFNNGTTCTVSGSARFGLAYDEVGGSTVTLSGGTVARPASGGDLFVSGVSVYGAATVSVQEDGSATMTVADGGAQVTLPDGTAQSFENGAVLAVKAGSPILLSGTAAGPNVLFGNPDNYRVAADANDGSVTVEGSNGVYALLDFTGHVKDAQDNATLYVEYGVAYYTLGQSASMDSARLEWGTVTGDGELVTAIPVTADGVTVTPAADAAFTLSYYDEVGHSLEMSGGTLRIAMESGKQLSVASPQFQIFTASGDVAFQLTYTEEEANGIAISPLNNCTVQVNEETGEILITAPTPNNAGGGGGGSSSSNSTTTTNPDGSSTTTTTQSNGTVVETTKYPDGSTTTVETKKDGSATETSKAADGTTGVTKTDKDGNVTEVTATVPAAAANAADKADEPVILPIQVGAATDSDDAVEIDVNVPSNGATIEIPVEDVTPGTVVVIVHADGTEEIVKTSTVSETGVVVTLDKDATIKIIDNSKEFGDVSDNYWAADAIDFVVAREIFGGTSANTFAPNGSMTRQAMWMVLARMSGENPADMAEAKAWAMETGISDGSNPINAVTRQQFVTMLWRWAQSQGYDTTQGGMAIREFADYEHISDYAMEAMTWAVNAGVISGYADNTLQSLNLATRAHVATFTQRFYENVKQ